MRSGLWVSGGIGGGWNLSEGLDGTRLGGTGAYIRMGGTLSPHFRLAGDIATWSDEIDTEDDLVRGTILASLSYYPWLDRGFSVRGGLGLSGVETGRPLRLPDHGNVEAGMESVTGFGSNLGFSYDIRLGSGRLHLSPNVDWYFQAFDPPPGLPGTNHLLLLTLGVTMY